MKKRNLNRISMVVKEKGRTNVWLAEQLGRHPNTISKWTQNVQQPHIDIFYKISVILDCDIRELFNSTKPNKGANNSIKK